jgi:uncharacterized protein (TIGR02391 family)
VTKYRLLHTIAPTIEDAINLPVEECAYALLDQISQDTRARAQHAGNINIDMAAAYDQPLHAQAQPQSPQTKRSWQLAFSSALNWLENTGLLVRQYDGNCVHIDVSARGRAIKSTEMFTSFVRENRIHRDALHPTIAGSSWPIYVRGHFDTAVFEAFKAIEVAVRNAGKFKNTDLGRDLMNKAFHPEKGPLRDDTIPASEREAIMILFAGAIGAFKNPASHRQVDLNDPVKAAQLMMTASTLLNIVDEAIVRNGL